MSNIPTIPADLAPRDGPANADEPANGTSSWPFLAIALVALLALWLYFR